MITVPLFIHIGNRHSLAADGPDLRCGSYCLYVALRALDVEVGEFSRLEQSLGQPEPRGYSMLALADCAKKLRAQALPVNTTCLNLSRRKGQFGCIALLDGGHFVLVNDIEGNDVSICDPPRMLNLSVQAFQSRWNGEALLISSGPIETEESLAGRHRTWQLLGRAAVAAGISLCAVLAAFGARYLRRRSLRTALIVVTSAIIGCSTDETTILSESIGPQIEIEDALREIDSVADEDSGKHTVDFRIVNRGDKELTIDELVSSCSCIRPHLSRSVVPPGEDTELTLTVDDRGASFPQDLQVTVVSNDPKRPSVAVSLRLQPVLSAIEFDPPQLDFGALASGTNAEARVQAKLRIGASEIGDLSSSVPESLTAEWLAPETKAELVVALRPHSAGRSDATISVTAGSRTFRLPVRWSAYDRIAVTPGALLLMSGPPGAKRRAEVRLTTTSPDMLDVASCVLSDSTETSSITFQRISDCEWAAEVHIVLPEQYGVWRGVATVTCTSPEHRNVVIPIVAMVERPEDG